MSEAFEELKKVELLDERDQARERAEESAREQADMDSIGLMRARLGRHRLTRFVHRSEQCQNPGRKARVFLLSNVGGIGGLVARLAQGMLRRFSIAPGVKSDGGSRFWGTLNADAS